MAVLSFLTMRHIRAATGFTDPQLMDLIKIGLPHTMSGRNYRFNLTEVKRFIKNLGDANYVHIDRFARTKYWLNVHPSNPDYKTL